MIFEEVPQYCDFEPTLRFMDKFHLGGIKERLGVKSLTNELEHIKDFYTSLLEVLEGKG